MSILKHFKLETEDKLEWDFEARNNEMIIIVKPIKSSNGKSLRYLEHIAERSQRPT